MKKVLIIFLLLLCFTTGCGGQKELTLEMNPDTIASVAISGYPIIFANGDSIDTTTNLNKVTNIASAFSKVTMTYYKTKEEWDKIAPAPTKNQKAIISFYNEKKECVERITRTNNADGSFIIKIVSNEVYIVSDKDYNELNSIFDTLIKEATDGRLSD